MFDRNFTDQSDQLLAISDNPKKLLSVINASELETITRSIELADLPIVDGKGHLTRKALLDLAKLPVDSAGYNQARLIVAHSFQKNIQEKPNLSMKDSAPTLNIFLENLKRRGGDSFFDINSRRHSPDWFILENEQFEIIKKLPALVQKFYRACNAIFANNVLDVNSSILADIDKTISSQFKPFPNDEVPLFFRFDLAVEDNNTIQITEIDPLGTGGVLLEHIMPFVHLSAGCTPPEGTEPLNFLLQGNVTGFLNFLKRKIGDLNNTNVTVIGADIESSNWLDAKGKDPYTSEFGVFAEELAAGGVTLETGNFTEIVKKILRDSNPRYLFRTFFMDELSPEQRKLWQELSKEGKIIELNPPSQSFLEAKLWLAVLWEPKFETELLKFMSTDELASLRKSVPQTFIVNRSFSSPVGGWRFEDVEKIAQEKDNLVLKVGATETEFSGGSRGVKFGFMMSEKEFRDTIWDCLDHNGNLTLQRKIRHKNHLFRVWNEKGSLETSTHNKMRLLAYVFPDITGCSVISALGAGFRNAMNVHGATDFCNVPISVKS